ncbi:MAG: hypothetical protein GY838_13075 [bacterium]|nr:hypothetical protein [bacterium]
MPLGADIQESDHLPDCTVCARELRALQRETRVANAEPVKVAPLPSPTTADLRCPICREPLKLGSKSIAPPTAGNGTVRVALLLLCTNEEGHQEKS